jgi:transcriptional regulator with XRE-family HTH domain
MTLKSYLKMKGIKPDDFAESVGFSKGGVLKWISGERYPRHEAISKIMEVTNGAVTANDFQEQIRSH